MKKYVIITFGVLLFIGTSFAKGPVFNRQNNIDQQKSTQSISSATYQWSWYSLKEEQRKKISLWQKFLWEDSLERRYTKIFTNSWACFTGNILGVRDQLSQKTQEISHKISLLVSSTTKIQYNTAVLSSLSQQLQVISLQIMSDCKAIELQQHRKDIKTILESLKEEIALLKKHINRLRDN